MRRIFRIQQCGRTFHGICKFGTILYAPFGFKVAVLMQMTQDLIIVTGLLAKVDSNRDSSSLLDYIIWWIGDNICYEFRCNSRNLSFQLKKNKGTSGIRRTPECWPISIRKPSESIIDDKPLISDDVPNFISVIKLFFGNYFQPQIDSILLSNLNGCS